MFYIIPDKEVYFTDPDTKEERLVGIEPASTDRIGDTKELTKLYTDHIQMFTVNPEDDAAWEIADVNGCEFGVKLVE